MNPLFSEGLNLALYGMGTVFVFLTVLVLAVKLMSSLVLRFEPADTRDKKPATEQKLRAVISAAVQQYREDQER